MERESVKYLEKWKRESVKYLEKWKRESVKYLEKWNGWNRWRKKEDKLLHMS